MSVGAVQLINGRLLMRFWVKPKVLPRSAFDPLRMNIIRTGSRKGIQSKGLLQGWRQVLKSQVAETILVTFMFAAAAAGVYVAAALVIGVLD